MDIDLSADEMKNMTNRLFHVKGIALIALLAALGGCESGSNQTEIVPDLAKREAMWDRQVIQIEQLWSDGNWYPREPLSLDRQSSIQRHAVGDPDFHVELESTYTNVDPNSLRLVRRVTAVCPDQNFRIFQVFDIASLPPAWQETIKCTNGTWRLTLVDSSSVLRPPIAKEGDIIPGGINESS